MGEHLVPAPVQDLAEPVHQFKIGVVAHHGAVFPLPVVLQELQDGAAGKAVPPLVLALYHRERVDVEILSAALRQLDVALVAELELCDRSPPSVVVGYKVILAQLGGGGQVQALTQQGGGEDRTGVTLLERRVYRHGGGDGRHEPARPVRVPQGIVDEFLVHGRLDGNTEFRLVAPRLQAVVHSHGQILL